MNGMMWPLRVGGNPVMKTCRSAAWAVRACDSGCDVGAARGEDSRAEVQQGGARFLIASPCAGAAAIGGRDLHHSAPPAPKAKQASAPVL